jgi:hypothetical protein
MKRVAVTSCLSPSTGVPRRIHREGRRNDHKEYEQALNDFSARIAGLRRTSEFLRVHSASRAEYLRAIRLAQILAEASHLSSRSASLEPRSRTVFLIRELTTTQVATTSTGDRATLTKAEASGAVLLVLPKSRIPISYQLIAATSNSDL